LARDVIKTYKIVL
jgi:ubiquitin-protein ligase